MKKRWLFLTLFILAIAGAVFWRGKTSPQEKPKPEAARPIAVIIGQAEQRDVPVWLTGIGTAQASATVTVRPRVGGSLDEITFTEGALVKANDILARIDPRPYQSALDQAEARQAQNAATLANAKLEAARFRNLFNQNAGSKQQLDQAESTVAQLDAVAQSDEAAIQAARLDLDFTTVRAPISGRTGVRMLDAGNLVTANQPGGLVVITQLQPINILFNLPQTHLAALSGKSTRLRVQALDQSSTLLDEGELELIDNQIDQATGTLRLKAVFKNDKLALWPGQFVSARVLVETRKNAIVVPAEAIVPGIDGPFCYVVKPDQTVEARPLKTGLATEEGTVIESGLTAGEKIITTGQAKLKPGAKVAAQDKVP